MNQDRVAFFIRAYNDVDHFVPVIAEFIKKNENPIIVVTSDIELENDYRIVYLKTLGVFEIFKDIDFDFINASKRGTILSKILSKFYSLKRNRKGLIGKLHRKLFYNASKQLDFLHSNNISTCVFEWSTPFDKGEVLEKYFLAATGIGLTTIAIPHGCNIFINSDVNIGYRKMIMKGNLVDQQDRDLFDYFILQNPIRRDGWIKWGLDPVKTQAWGSTRFYPDWAKTNKDICPKFIPDVVEDGKLKVVFMQFQKDYNVHNELVMDALRELSHFNFISLAVKDATRAGKEYFNKENSGSVLGDALIGWYGNEVHSPALIDWADCVIVIGGSIGIEAMLQNKHVVYPTYLNSNHTMYEYYQAAHCPNGFSEIKKLLEDLHMNKKTPTLPGVENMLREIIYAGNKPYNVPLKYYEKIKEKNLSYGLNISDK